jgi:predicted nucleotidyltransferase
MCYYYLEMGFAMLISDKESPMLEATIQMPKDQIAEFCRRWQIKEIALFGSVLRDDFGPESDLDILVSFSADADWGLLDHLKMEEELTAIFNRKIDLLTKRAVEQSHNHLRRQEILRTAEVVYVT